MKNTEKAVTIIAVLSLLLGFSLGQNHLQYLKLKKVKAATVAPFSPLHHQHVHTFDGDGHHERLQEKMEELRFRLEEKKMHLEEQRLHLEEVQVRALEAQEQNRIRFEVKDPENGQNTIIRIVREE